MSPHSGHRGSVRPAAVVNDEIRAIVRGAQDRAWTFAERALYGLLLEEWETALRDGADRLPARQGPGQRECALAGSRAG